MAVRGDWLMFGRRGKPAESRGVDSIFGPETMVEGMITGNGSIRIDGQIKGDINISGDVSVGQKAHVEATICARNVVVAGELIGTIRASGKLEILPTGRLHGDVFVSSLVVDDGAIFIGGCKMSHSDNSGPELLPSGNDNIETGEDKDKPGLTEGQLDMDKQAGDL